MSFRTLITSRDPQGRQATNLFEAAYDKANLNRDRAQQLNERGGEFQKGIGRLIEDLTMPDYPKEYKRPKPIKKQIIQVARLFNLDPAKAFQYADTRPKLPEGAEGWFAIPRISAVRDKHFPRITDPEEQDYCAAQLFLGKLEETIEGFSDNNDFRDRDDGEFDHDTAMISGYYARRFEALQKIAAIQDYSEILLIPAQFGRRHRGEKPPWKSFDISPKNEFPLGLFEASVMLYTHQERVQRFSELHVNTAGDFVDDYCFEFDCSLKLSRSDDRSYQDGWVTGFLVEG